MFTGLTTFVPGVESVDSVRESACVIVTTFATDGQLIDLPASYLSLCCSNTFACESKRPQRLSHYHCISL